MSDVMQAIQTASKVADLAIDVFKWGVDLLRASRDAADAAARVEVERQHLLALQRRISDEIFHREIGL